VQIEWEEYFKNKNAQVGGVPERLCGVYPYSREKA